MDLKVASGISLTPGLTESMSWRWVAEWFARHPDDLWLRRLTFPGQADTLRIYAVRPTYQSNHVDLPLSGREPVRVYTSEWQFEIPGLWERALESGLNEVLDRLCTDLQLSCRHAEAPVRSNQTLCYRVIAGTLGLTQFEQDEWRCVSPVLDTAGSAGLELREDLLSAFPQVTVKAPQHPYPPESLGEAAFGYWVITREGEPQVMVSEGGLAYLPDGRIMEFEQLIGTSRRLGEHDRIAPVIAAIVEALP